MQKEQNKPAMDCAKTKKYFVGPVATEFVAASTGVWRVERPDVKLADCIFCATCQKHCPADVITVEKAEPNRGVHIDWTYCKGCGICANSCPAKAITMKEEGL